jgi:hypothetical protein
MSMMVKEFTTVVNANPIVFKTVETLHSDILMLHSMLEQAVILLLGQNSCNTTIAS